METTMPISGAQSVAFGESPMALSSFRKTDSPILHRSPGQALQVFDRELPEVPVRRLAVVLPVHANRHRAPGKPADEAEARTELPLAVADQHPAPLGGRRDLQVPEQLRPPLAFGREAETELPFDVAYARR